MNLTLAMVWMIIVCVYSCFSLYNMFTVYQLEYACCRTRPARVLLSDFSCPHYMKAVNSQKCIGNS